MCIQAAQDLNLFECTFQVLLNCWCVWVLCQEVAGYGMSKGMTFWGNRYDPSMAGFRVGFAIWVHYNNKYVELLDTAWMLLRKKDRQVCCSALTGTPLITVP